jgi:hypothetical protein
MDYAFDAHPPVSPPRSAEKLFFGSDLPTQNISAAALAQQIHDNHKTSSYADSYGGMSVDTDDFKSVRSSMVSNNANFVDAHHFFPTDSESPFGNDALTRDIFASPTLDEDASINSDPTHYQDSSMTTAPEHVDVASNAYDVAKKIWSWGKKQMLVKPFLGMAEGVASKVVGIALGGMTLETVDEKVGEHLHGFDDSVLNPALTALIKVLLGAVGKASDIVTPIINIVSKPMVKSSPENPEMTTSLPGLTKAAS